MLKNFFKLNGTPTNYDSPAVLVNHFTTATDIHDVVYTPNEWPSQLHRVSGKTFENVSLSKKTIKQVTFLKCRFEDCLFVATRFSEVEFHRCEMKNCNFFKCTFDDCYIDPSTISFDRAYRKTHANIGVSLYQSLTENASKQRQSDYERKADIEFRRWKRWQLSFDERDGKINYAERIRRTVFSVSYELIAGFGYKPARFVVATVIFFTGFSILNTFVLPGSLSNGTGPIGHITFPDGVYFTYSMKSWLRLLEQLRTKDKWIPAGVGWYIWTAPTVLPLQLAIAGNLAASLLNITPLKGADRPEPVTLPLRGV